MSGGIDITKLVYVGMVHLHIFWMAEYNPYPCELSLIGNKTQLIGQDFLLGSGAISTRLDRKECA